MSPLQLLAVSLSLSPSQIDIDHLSSHPFEGEQIHHYDADDDDDIVTSRAGDGIVHLHIDEEAPYLAAHRPHLWRLSQSRMPCPLEETDGPIPGEGLEETDGPIPDPVDVFLQVAAGATGLWVGVGTELHHLRLGPQDIHMADVVGMLGAAQAVRVHARAHGYGPRELLELADALTRMDDFASRDTAAAILLLAAAS
jgi:hypothetical protein